YGGRMRRFLIFAAAIALAVWFYRKEHKDAALAPSAGAATSPGPGCLMAAESRVSSAISSAESACSGGTTEAERTGMEDAREALTLMRATLSEGTHAALGAGGFQGAMRQEAIDNRLSAARGKFR